MKLRLSLALIALILVIQTPSFGEEVPSATPAKPLDEVATKIGEDLYRIGKAAVDRKKGEVTVEGKVNMQQVLIELLACTPKG